MKQFTKPPFLQISSDVSFQMFDNSTVNLKKMSMIIKKNECASKRKDRMDAIKLKPFLVKP